jgi:DNA polymerase
MSDTLPAIAIDFETFYSPKLKYSLTNLHAEQYCRHPLFDAYMVSVSDGVTAWAGDIRELNWRDLHGRTWLSHNRAFDNTVWDRLRELGLVPAEVYPGAWHCTANMTAYLCNRRSLAESVEHLFKVKLSKESRANAANKHWPADFTPAERTAMLSYAKDDAIWCQKLWTKFSDQWPEHERRLSTLTIDQGRRGVQMDTDLLNIFILQSHDLKRATEQCLPWLTESEDPLDDTWDDFNPVPTSTKCIAEQCRRAGIPCPPVKSKDGEDAYEEWEALYGPAHPWIAAMSNWRSANKLLKTFETAKRRIRPDGTMPFDLKYFAAHTGRWGGGSKLNFQNFRKVPIFVRVSDGLMETDESKVLAAVKQEKKTGTLPDWVLGKPLDFRRLIIPRPGHKMITSDLSQIEPRGEAWLCKDEKLLGMIRSGYGVYESFARANMGWTGGKLSAEDPDRYQLTKIQVLGLGFGCGWEKFITIAAGYGIDLTKDDPEFLIDINPFTNVETKVSGYGATSKALVAKFRADNPKMVALWKALDSAFKQSVGSDFILRLPSGRALRYEGVRRESRIVPDKDNPGKTKREETYTALVGSRRVKTYGAKLCENITQATARDIFAHNLLALLDAGVHILFTSHDEAVNEIPLDSPLGVREVDACMTQCPAWIPGLPVAADTKQVAHYLK